MNGKISEVAAAAARSIRVERARQDVRQDELAYLADISQQFLSRIENGRGTASLETYIKIADALHMDFLDLFREDKSVSPPEDEMLERLLSGCSDYERLVCTKAVEAIVFGIREGKKLFEILP